MEDKNSVKEGYKPPVAPVVDNSLNVIESDLHRVLDMLDPVSTVSLSVRGLNSEANAISKSRVVLDSVLDRLSQWRTSQVADNQDKNLSEDAGQRCSTTTITKVNSALAPSNPIFPYVLRQDARTARCTGCGNEHKCRTVDGPLSIWRLCAQCFREIDWAYQEPPASASKPATETSVASSTPTVRDEGVVLHESESVSPFLEQDEEEEDKNQS